mmetsp:Transcript_51639/g.136426  ORF Transcript_51639/g.136426 Transcript_51639/m.136426 type:complete len:213 (+) Transcript_51639:521-1159(+)
MPYSVQLDTGFDQQSECGCQWTEHETDAWDVWARRWEEELRTVEHLQEAPRTSAQPARNPLQRRRPEEYRYRVEEDSRKQQGKADGSKQWRRASSGATAPRPPTPESRPALSSAQQFDAWEQKWEKFERSSSASSTVSAAAIPWPPAGMTVSGISNSDSGQEKKSKLKKALLRWHPDKWHAVMQKIPASQQTQVLEKVKAVAQLVLDEKSRA